MIKLKNILSEAYAWERQEGKSLPTLAEVQAAYDAKMQEQSEDDYMDEAAPEQYNHDDDEDDYMDEAAKPDFLDLDGDGNETESMKSAAADSKSHPDGNFINKARALFHLKNGGSVYGINGSNEGTKITNASDLDKYSKASGGKGWTIKEGDDENHGVYATMPKNKESDVRLESFNKRMLGNLHGHEYILREAFKRN
jgi:hypothetical protein